MKETTPSDRVQLIDRGSLMHPGCCALCGSGNCDDGYVDTGIWYDYEGQIYFCWTCATQIASVIGCLSGDEHEHLKGILESTVDALSSVKAELNHANERLSHYDAIFVGAAPISINGASVTSSDTITLQSEAEPAESAVNDDPPVGTDSGEPVVKEPVKGSGRRIAPRTERSDSSSSNSLTI